MPGQSSIEKNFLEIKNALAEISPKVWGTQDDIILPFNKKYKVYASKDSAETLKRLFGNHFKISLRNKIRSIYAVKPSSQVFALPDDSILISKLEKDRVIIASAKNKIVLKLCLVPQNFYLIESEIKAYEEIKNSSFAPFVNVIHQHGVTSNNIKWIAVSFNENYEALSGEAYPEKLFLNNVSEFLAPMKLFYEAHGAQELSLAKWLKMSKEIISVHPSGYKLKKLIEFIENESQKFPQIKMIDSQLHFDLHAGNLLKSKTLTYIDWEMSARGLILIDMLDSYRRYLNKSKFEKWKFYSFMKGDKRMPPEKMESFFQDLNGIFGHFPKGSEKILFCVYIVERVLIYYRSFGKVDRLSQKGFEVDFIRKF